MQLAQAPDRFVLKELIRAYTIKSEPGRGAARPSIPSKVRFIGATAEVQPRPQLRRFEPAGIAQWKVRSRLQSRLS